MPLANKTKSGLTAALREKTKQILFALDHGTNATSAQGFMNFLPILNHHNFLEIWVKSPVGCTLREAPVMSKSRFLSTSITNGHFQSFQLLNCQ